MTLLSVIVILKNKVNLLNLILSSILFAFSVYLNPNHLIFISAIMVIIRMKYADKTLNIFLYVLSFITIMLISLCFFLYLSY